MKKISLKIILMMVLIFFILSSLAKLIFSLSVGFDFNFEEQRTAFFYVSIISVLISLISFTLVINFFIVKRIKMINEATKKIMCGDFDIKIQDDKKDEISNLSQNFNEMAKALKSNEYLSENFVRNISHQIKTPLSVIQGYSLLLKENLVEEKLKDYANLIGEEAHRLSKLSKDLLQISRLDSIIIIKMDEEVKPSTQIKDILVSLQPKWEIRNLEFDLELSSNKVLSNQSLLYEVFQNLIDNAIQYSNEKTRIEILLEIDEKKLIFEISNEGNKIKEEEKENIFKQFYRGENNNPLGSGLGLSIVQSIILKMKGQIFLKETSEDKNCFRVEIPLKGIIESI